MNKKSKLAILASTLAVVGAFGYSAYATGGQEAMNKSGKMLDKAVEKGILSEEKKTELQNFTKEEMKEMIQKKMDGKLNKAVEDGIITSEEAQEIRDWQSLKPEAMEKLKPMGKFSEKKSQWMNKQNANTETQ